MMPKWTVVLLLVLMYALPAAAGNKQQGAATVKDFQPAGTTDKKHKHQQFDFTFIASGIQYTCRSPEGTKLKAIEFPVNSEITYEVDKDKGKVKNASGKEVKCTVMRVEKLPDMPKPDAPK